MNDNDFAGLYFLCVKWIAARHRWSIKTAHYYGLLVWALTHPAVATVPNVLGTRDTPEFRRRIITEYVDQYLRMLNDTGLSSRVIDCVYVDGAFQCKWTER